MKTIKISIGIFLFVFVFCSRIQSQSCMYSNASATVDLAAMKTTGFTDMIVSLMSIQPNGDITFGPYTLCSNGVYTMGNYLPNYAADMAGLKTGLTSIKRVEIGIGGWGNGSFTNVRDLINSQGTGSGSVLYRNFQALKNTIPSIDAINNDDEATYDASTTVSFAVMLGNLGYKYTLSPYMNRSFWQTATASINSQRPGTLDRVYVQTYDGGSGNNPCDWNFGVDIWGGCWDYSSGTDVTNTLNSWKNQCGIKGGMMWFERSDRITYAKAINSVFGVRPPASTGLVTVYADINYTGYSGGLGVGDYTTAQLNTLGIKDDDITSVKVTEGYKVK